jgi:GNAT superfamily N-acetyltransferase
MNEEPIIRVVAGEECGDLVPALSAILVDCVEGGASVSFMAPISLETAQQFWLAVSDGVAAGERILLVAEEPSTGEVLGTAQVVMGLPENQPHRAEIAKVLVRRSARRRGIAARLMRAAEDAARAAGKTLLVLDAVTGGDAERLYEREGWTRVGVIPGFALMPDGRPCSTTYFYKQLSEPAQ